MSSAILAGITARSRTLPGGELCELSALTLLPFLIVIYVDVETVILAWVYVVPNVMLFRVIAALALFSVAYVAHRLAILRS